MDKGSEYYAMYLKGDNEGMALLIKEYADGLKLFLNTYVQNIHIAEELMIDTFAKIGYKKPRKKNNTQFKTWLYAIGKNTAFDYLRKNKIPQVSLEETGDIAVCEELEKHILEAERRKIIYSAIKTLKSDYRQALWLVYFEDMTVKQVATIMGRSVHAIENMLSRARKGLKEELEREGFSYEDL